MVPSSSFAAGTGEAVDIASTVVVAVSIASARVPDIASIVGIVEQVASTAFTRVVVVVGTKEAVVSIASAPEADPEVEVVAAPEVEVAGITPAADTASTDQAAEEAVANTSSVTGEEATAVSKLAITFAVA